MKLSDILQRSQQLVKQLSEGMNLGEMNLEQTEAKILEFVYELARRGAV